MSASPILIRLINFMHRLKYGRFFTTFSSKGNYEQTFGLNPVRYIAAVEKILQRSNQRKFSISFGEKN